MLVETGELKKNLARACNMIREAGKKDSDVIVLPESLDFGWTLPEAKELAEPTSG